MAQRHVTTHRGCGLSWFVRGSGPPVVLIQGVGVGAGGWALQLDALVAKHSCLCFDNRGFGASQPVGEALSLELMASDVLALMDAMAGPVAAAQGGLDLDSAAGWGSAHLVGHSLGGLVALYVAGAAPKRVRSLSLLCTFASGAVPTRPAPSLIWTGLRTRIGTRRMRRHAFLRLVLSRSELRRTDGDSLARGLADMFGHDLADQPPVVMQQFRAMKRADATRWLSDLAGVPTLVVSGAEDPIAPPWAGRALADGIPGARFVEIADASHGAVVQRAPVINELLLEHLRVAEGGGIRGRGHDR